MSLAEWILFLDLSVWIVHDYSIQFSRAFISLLSPILWNDDAKLLKQKLLDDFWWYFGTGATRWNTMFLLFLHYQLLLLKLIYFHIMTPNIFWINLFYRNLVHVSWIVFQPLMIRIILAYWYCRLPSKVIVFGILPFLFIIIILSTDHNHFCI